MLSSQRLCPSSCRSFVAFIAHLGFVTIRKTSRKKRNKRGFSLPTVARDSKHYRYIIQVLLQPHPTPSFSAKACWLPVAHQTPPNLPLHPVSDKRLRHELERNKDNQKRDDSQDRTPIIGQRKSDWVFVQLAAVCEKPDAVDPKERNERQQPESLEVLIMLQDFGIVDVKSENDDCSVAACGSEAAQLLNVLDPVPASTRWTPIGLPRVVHFRLRFCIGETQEKEDRKSAEPCGKLQVRGRGSRHHPNGIESG